jgi:hypothetical protein
MSVAWLCCLVVLSGLNNNCFQKPGFSSRCTQCALLSQHPLVSISDGLPCPAESGDYWVVPFVPIFLFTVLSCNCTSLPNVCILFYRLCSQLLAVQKMHVCVGYVGVLFCTVLIRSCNSGCQPLVNTACQQSHWQTDSRFLF